MLICSSIIGGNKVPSQCRNAGPVTYLQDGYQQHPEGNLQTCASAIQWTVLTQEEMVLAQAGLCCLLLPKKERCCAQSTWPHPKRLSTLQTSLQTKDREKINIRMRINKNLRRKMVWSVHLDTRCRSENSNSPIVCVVLALDSWNYSPIFFIWLNYWASNKNKVLPPYVNSPCHKVADAGNSTSS